MYISSVGAQNWAKDHPIVVCIHIGQKTGYPKGSIALAMRLYFFYRQVYVQLKFLYFIQEMDWSFVDMHRSRPK
jgi:hypothetical protein